MSVKLSSKKKSVLYILIVLALGLLIGTFSIWRNSIKVRSRVSSISNQIILPGQLLTSNVFSTCENEAGGMSATFQCSYYFLKLSKNNGNFTQNLRQLDGELKAMGYYTDASPEASGGLTLDIQLSKDPLTMSENGVLVEYFNPKFGQLWLEGDEYGYKDLPFIHDPQYDAMRKYTLHKGEYIISIWSDAEDYLNVTYL